MHLPGRHRNRVTALFAVAALLWQSLLPLLPAPTGAAAELVAICTEHGLRMVSVAAASSNDGETPARTTPGKVDCPLCASLHLTAGCPGASDVVLQRQDTDEVFAGYVHRAFFAPLKHQQLARAPPVIA